MFNIDNLTAATGAMPTPEAVGPNPNGWFTKGNPPGGIPGTKVTADFLNAIQAELANIVTANGTALSKTNQTQVLTAIKALIQSGALNYTTSASVANTYAATLTGITSYTTGLVAFVKFTNGNTSISTINFNGLGQQALNVNGNTNLTGGEIVALMTGILVYNGASWNLLNPAKATTVVTNANLTGMVTSSGNATTVVTNANLTGMVTSSGNATTVVTNANLTGDVTSSGNATTYAGIMPLAKGGSGFANSQQLVQRVCSAGLSSSGSTTYTLGSSAPTTSGGTQVASVTITPKSASNSLRLRLNGHHGNGSNLVNIFGIFQDANATALVTATASCNTLGDQQTSFEYEMIAGTTSATTFKIRMGASGASTWVIGNVGAVFSMGGAYFATFSIEEYTP